MKLKNAKCPAEPQNECIVHSVRLLGMLLFGLSIICAPTSPVHGAVGPNWIEQWGITWTFDKNLSTNGAGETYQYGTFANGDYWVVGPVSMIGINPLSREVNDRTKNGAMINPRGNSTYLDNIFATQGFDSAMSNFTYSADKNVALDVSENNPLLLPPSTSLISSISHDSVMRPQLRSAAVLTILGSVPPVNSFRPSYAGTDKTIKHTLSDIDYSPLKSLELTTDAPSLSTVAGYFERPWLDWKGDSDGGRGIHATQNMPDYGREMAMQIGDAALLLNSNSPNEDKTLLLIRFLQYAIDIWGVYKADIKCAWMQSGGHGPGRKFPILFAGVVLNDTEMAAIGTHALNDPYFGEDHTTFYLTEYEATRFIEPAGSTFAEGGRYVTINAVNLHAEYEDAYYVEEDWTFVNLNGQTGIPEYSKNGINSPLSDFQGRWINRRYDASYRANGLSNSLAGFVLATHIMGLKEAWNHDALFDYTDRWMNPDTWPDNWPGTYVNGLHERSISLFHRSMWDRCRSDYGPIWPETSANQPPTAHAGGDQAVVDTDDNGTELVTLDGSASTDDSGIVSYVWSDNLGDTIPNGSNPTATLSMGSHIITLTVTDNNDMTDTDNVTITIQQAGSNDPVWSSESIYSFDGVDDFFEIPTTNWRANSGTISLWAYAEDLSVSRYLFGHTIGSWSNRIQLYIRDGNLGLGLGDTNSRHTNISSIQLRRWYHIALSWSGTEYAVYVDGLEKATGSYSGLTQLNDFSDIGNTGNPSWRDQEAFHGFIKDVHIYNRALASQEILALYNDLSMVGLVGYCEFSEGSGTITADASGLGNTGTLINGPTWVSRNNDSALSFDGVDDYVDCGNDPSLNLTSNLTISAWINPISFGQNGYGRIVDKGSSSTGFSFFLNEADNGLGYVIYGGTLVWSDASVIALNQQQYVAVVYSEISSTITFYVDGLPVGSSNYQTNPIDSSNDPLYIGIRGYDMNRDFDGIIDEVRIYNRALSADEILEIAGSGTPANNPPTAGNDSATVDEDSADNAIDVLANDTDADGDTLTITSVTQATHGSVAITGGGTGLAYTPAPDYNGPDSFTYTISDGQGGIDTATVSVTVTNVPDTPILGTIGDKTINENQMLTITVNATDADGDTLEYSVQQLPPGATFASPFVWTPTYDDEGTYEVIFVASDGTLSDSETITITVNNVNQSPVAVDDSAVTDEDTTVITGNVLTNDTDADGHILGIDSATQATHGTAVYNNDGTFTYTPAANYNGSDSFTYTVSDGNGGTATATVQIEVTAINDPPDVSAIPDTLQKYENEAILPAEIELATDVDSGDTLTYTYIPDLQATDYILHVDVSDGTVTVGKDITIIVIPVPPVVISVTPTKYAVEILFSEDLERSSAENIGNYSFSNGIVTNTVTLNAEPDKVTLYTTAHAEDTIYTLTITGVEDLAANSISETNNNYTYDAGLIGLWNFNTDGGNTALDASGYDNTATLVNGPVWTEQGDLNFDGINDAVEIPTADWNVNSGTVALWAYAEDLAGTHYLFGHTTGSGSDRIQLYTLDQNLNLGLGNSDELNIENLDSQTWHHFVLTWEGTDYVVYVDGIEKSSGFYTGLNNLSEFADIGNSGDVSFDNAFAGYIDDARVYDRALTPDEVVNVYLMSDESIRESKALAFEVSATYPDGTALIYSDSYPNLLLDDTLDGASFENSIFAWNPWYDQAGTYDITFLPADQEQPQYSQTVTVVVEDVQLSGWYQTWLEHLGLL